MSEKELDLSDEAADQDPIGSPRLASAVGFGLRVAALAGLVLSAATAAGVADVVFDSPAFIGHPTCCGTTVTR